MTRLSPARPRHRHRRHRQWHASTAALRRQRRSGRWPRPAAPASPPHPARPRAPSHGASSAHRRPAPLGARTAIRRRRGPRHGADGERADGASRAPRIAATSAPRRTGHPLVDAQMVLRDPLLLPVTRAHAAYEAGGRESGRSPRRPQCQPDQCRTRRTVRRGGRSSVGAAAAAAAAAPTVADASPAPLDVMAMSAACAALRIGRVGATTGSSDAIVRRWRCRRGHCCRCCCRRRRRRRRR